MTEHSDSKSTSSRIRLSLAIFAAMIFAIGLLIDLLSAAAHAQNEDRVKAGLATWRNSGCADCHGAFADGDKQRDEMPTGANLRTTKLDAAALRQIVSCGRPGTGMPSFDEGAYKVRACNGRALGEPPSDLFPAPTTLAPDEIEDVVSYLQARVIGKRGAISKQECLFYYSDDPDWCDDY